MKKGTKLAKRTTPRSLPTGRKAWGKDVKVTPLGTLLKTTREQKQIAQREIAEALAKKVGGPASNVRVSAFELGKRAPSDEELAVLASMLGLSIASVRAKRDESVPIIKAAAKKAYREKVAGKAPLKAQTKLAPKPAERVAAKRVSAPEPASAPALSDFIDLIDGIVPMPVDKDARKRWLASTMELFQIGGNA